MLEASNQTKIFGGLRKVIAESNGDQKAKLILAEFLLILNTNFLVGYGLVGIANKSSLGALLVLAAFAIAVVSFFSPLKMAKSLLEKYYRERSPELRVVGFVLLEVEFAGCVLFQVMLAVVSILGAACVVL